MSPELNIAHKAVIAAADAINRLTQRDALLSVEKKRKNDYVSKADRASEQIIIQTLSRAYPDDAILAEESGSIGPKDAARTWIIDPLDGTTNYLHDFPFYAISVALKEDNKITHGMIYDPIRDELFTASRGRGAFLNGHRLRIDNTSTLDGSIIATGFPFRNPEYISRYMVQFKSILKMVGDIRRAGSAALDLAYVAAGRVDGFWESSLESWDIAAGSLLVSEAGGQCLDFNAKNDYLSSGNIVAGNLKITAGLVAKIKQTESA